ncbi:CUB domain-containing protein 1-like isoform X2 [Thalassophryne amazonica]|uniref:CUB domain-containing protein 1-like isoform X2 n=1 Tax=Thalassophryne amazonica TaxID=390379 RepID=UPI0014712649|nr:CUB domain-containing protein 1-like isoform X2 [Thalassophryne amazonica]
MSLLFFLLFLLLPVLSVSESCEVNMRRLKGFLLYIKKLRPASDCEMKINSVTQEKITVPSDRITWLTFKDCFPEDVQVIARRVIACSHLEDCPKGPFSLAMPTLPHCFPAPLSSVTWNLQPPLYGSMELRSTTVPIRQSLPGQLCNDSIIIKVAEDDGSSVGHFCPQGAIEKLELHTNTSVTISSTEGKALRMSSQPLLAASFKGEISERYIFTVSLKKDTPVLLGTPGWPVGMKSYATVSWIVSVPPKMEAHLMFANLKQPKCGDRHTYIQVQRFGSLEEDYSRREDEEADSEITVSERFYLNMSNCMPETGEFSVITKITLQRSQKLLLTVILSVVAVMVVIFAVVLAVVCVVFRKNKQQLSHQVSIYNPNGTSFLPGHSGFPTPEYDESHVYASIEDTLVYTHLLRKGVEIGIYGDHDPYPSFTGPPDTQRPPISKDAKPDNQKVNVYQSFQNGPPVPSRPASHTKSMIENELYQGEKENTADLSPNTLLGPRKEPEGGN